MSPVCLQATCNVTFSVVSDRNSLKHEWSFFTSMKIKLFFVKYAELLGLRNPSWKGGKPVFPLMGCMGHRTQRAALHCRKFHTKPFSTSKKFHAKTFHTYPESHLSWRHSSFGVWSCPSAASTSQRYRWLVLQPWGQQPPSITQV